MQTQSNAQTIFDEHTQEGGLWDLGAAHSRLLIEVWRTLARGQPIAEDQVNRIIADLDIEAEPAPGHS